MANETQSEPIEAPEPEMTAERWFAEGQQIELERIHNIRNSEMRHAALQEFSKTNRAFLEERIAQQQNGPAEKARSHPAIDAAINETINREKGWVKDIAGMTDEQLRDRYLERAMRQDIDRSRVDRRIVFGDYKRERPEIVEIAGKYTRSELERKEVLSRMIQDRHFNVSKAKVEYERERNPALVATAEKNIAHRRLRGPAYNDVLYAEVSQVKRTLTNAKAAGFKF
jgi:hypothetical protein